MGRPKKENPKNRQLRLRLTEKDWQLIDIMSKRCKCTKTTLLMLGICELMLHFSHEDLVQLNDELIKRIENRKESM